MKIRNLEPIPPQWVWDLNERVRPNEIDKSLKWYWEEGSNFCLMRVTVAGARAMSPGQLSREVQLCYQTIFERLDRASLQPWRLWNYIPGINDITMPNRDRYMDFNLGRAEAFDEYSPPQSSSRNVPTASGVGIDDHDLTVWCVAGKTVGIQIENPRQIPAYRYSTKYGPRPPHFSRATLVNLQNGNRLFIGGTASIKGEDSCHDDINRQLDETLGNLSRLIQYAGEISKTDFGSYGNRLDPLEACTSMRIYIVRNDDAELVEKTLSSRCREGCEREYVLAQLCRPELLVEIEGVV